jgi:anti-anti-sigma regulatory factor
MAGLNEISNTQNKNAKISVDIVQMEDRALIKLNGFWTTHYIAMIETRMSGIKNSSIKTICFDFTHVKELDTAGAWIIHNCAKKLQKDGILIAFEAMDKQYEKLLQVVALVSWRD